MNLIEELEQEVNSLADSNIGKVIDAVLLEIGRCKICGLKREKLSTYVKLKIKYTRFKRIGSGDYYRESQFTNWRSYDEFLEHLKQAIKLARKEYYSVNCNCPI